MADANKQAADEIVKVADGAAKNIEEKAQGLGSKVSSTMAAVGKKAAAGIGAGVAAAAGGVAVVGTAAVNAANDLDKATNQLSASLGLSKADAEKYKDTITAIYGNNFGESFEDIANNISLIKQQMRGLSDADIQPVIEAAYMMSDVYDMDIAEGIRGANALVNQFGISAKEAYNLMAQGAENGLNQNGDLADQLSEYSTFYADMGFSAEQALSMMISGAKSGAYQIDFLNDAFKEFSIRAKDGSTTTAEGLNALGLDAEKLTAEFAAGGDRAYKAFQLVNAQLAACDDDVVQNAAGVALYGTKWEDLGRDAVLAMSQMDGAIDTQRDKLAEMNDVKYSSLSDMFEGLTRTMEMLLIPLGETLIPVLKEVIEAITPIIEELLPEISELITPIISDLSELIEPLIDIIKNVLPQFVELLKPLMSFLGDAIQRIAPTLIELLNKLLPPLIEVVEKLLPPLLEVVDALMPILDIAIALLEPILDLIVALADPLGMIIGAVGQLLGAFVSLITGALEPIMPIFEGIINILISFLAPAIEFVAQTVSALADVFSGVAKFLSGDIMGAIEQFGQGFVDLFSNVLGAIDGMFGTSLQKWYDDTVKACENIGRAMYEATHQDEIETVNLSSKYSSLQTDMNDYIIDQLRKGVSAEDALNSAKNRYLDTDEKKRAYDVWLSDYLNQDKVDEWYNNIRESNGLYSQGYKPYSSTDNLSAKAEEQSKNDIKKTSANISSGYTYTAPEFSVDDLGFEKFAYTPSNIDIPTYTPTQSSLGTSSISVGNTQKSKTASVVKPTYSNTVPTVDSATATAKVNSGNTEGNTINITSYIPTMWDNAKEANNKLAAAIGKSKVGNSSSAKIISGLSTKAMSADTTEKADATLNDVVAELKNLKTAQEKMQYTLDVTLKTNDYTLAKATVKGIKKITKQTGKSPL